MKMRKLSLFLLLFVGVASCNHDGSMGYLQKESHNVGTSRLSGLCNKFHEDMLLKQKISNEAHKEVSFERARYKQAVEDEMYSRIAYNCAIRANANRFFRVSDNDIDAVNRALERGCLNSADNAVIAWTHEPLGGYVDNDDTRNEAKFRVKRLFEVLIEQWQQEDQK